MLVKDITILNSVGLHARPAAKFVQTAARFPCEIKVCNSTKESAFVNAKSILSVLSLGIDQGHSITIHAHGEKELEAMEALEKLIAENFGE
ncbi:MAG: HPr family phosphocarrier protein [Anaerolineaceae bacterium]|nr:HPr family phosphocarrier protein [Anaerolineaceae bacterium]